MTSGGIPDTPHPPAWDQDYHLFEELSKWIGQLHKAETYALQMAPKGYKGRLEERGADLPCGFRVRHYAGEVCSRILIRPRLNTALKPNPDPARRCFTTCGAGVAPSRTSLAS